MHYRVRYLLDFDLKICSGQVWTSEGFKWHKIDPKWVRVTTWFFWRQFDIIQSFQRSAIPQTGSEFLEMGLLWLVLSADLLLSVPKSWFLYYKHMFVPTISQYLVPNVSKCNIFNLIDIGSIMESGENSFFIISAMPAIA